MNGKRYTQVLNRLPEIVTFLGQRAVVEPNRPPCEIPARENQQRQHGYLLPVTVAASGTAGSIGKAHH